MRRPLRSAALAAALLAVGLGGCARTVDTFKPTISLISPAGGVSRAKSFLVDGYALDDSGVTQITVDGQAIPILPGSRKLAHFQFRTLIQGDKGQYLIAATDAAGNRGTLVLPVSVDAAVPALRINRVERSGNLVRVAGVATDNIRVAQVLVDGNRLNITPGPRVEFYAETTGIWADVVVVDAAGNRTTTRAR